MKKIWTHVWKYLSAWENILKITHAECDENKKINKFNVKFSNERKKGDGNFFRKSLLVDAFFSGFLKGIFFHQKFHNIFNSKALKIVPNSFKFLRLKVSKKLLKKFSKKDISSNENWNFGSHKIDLNSEPTCYHINRMLFAWIIARHFKCH